MPVIRMQARWPICGSRRANEPMHGVMRGVTSAVGYIGERAPWRGTQSGLSGNFGRTMRTRRSPIGSRLASREYCRTSPGDFVACALASQTKSSTLLTRGRAQPPPSIPMAAKSRKSHLPFSVAEMLVYRPMAIKRFMRALRPAASASTSTITLVTRR